MSDKRRKYHAGAQDTENLGNADIDISADSVGVPTEGAGASDAAGKGKIHDAWDGNRGSRCGSTATKDERPGTAGADNSTAGADHGNAGTGHGIAGADSGAADADHGAAGEDPGKADGNAGSESGSPQVEALKEELDAVRSELEEQKKKCGEYLDRMQRIAAEFDNFKKRTVKEKEALYDDAVCDVIRQFLPAIDNLERAQEAVTADSSAQSLREGVEMILRQFREIMKNIGVEEIKALNETFDPMLHNAVMHVEDDSVGHGVIVEEFQKGYRYKDRVIRYSMVKVAN